MINLTQIQIDEDFYLNKLKYIFKQRKERRSQYSLRAFARDLNISISQLSMVLNKKKGLSHTKILLIMTKLDLSSLEKKLFLHSALIKFSRGQKDKSDAINEFNKIVTEANIKEITEDQFKTLYEIEHFSLLEMTKLKSFKSDHFWIAQKLELSHRRINEIASRLIRLGLLKINQNGTYQISYKALTVPKFNNNDFYLKHHSRLFHKAISSLKTLSSEKADFSNICFTFDSSKVHEVKKMIIKFRRELAEKFEVEHKNPDSVYILASQFFPLVKLD